MEAGHMAWRRIREAQSSGKCKCRFWAASKGKRQRRRRKNCTRKVGRLERRSPWLVGPALMNVLWLYSFPCTLVPFPLSPHSLSSTRCPSLLPLKKSRFHTCKEAWFCLSEPGLFASCDDFQSHLFPWKWRYFVLLRGCINVCVYMYDEVVCVYIHATFSALFCQQISRLSINELFWILLQWTWSVGVFVACSLMSPLKSTPRNGIAGTCVSFIFSILLGTSLLISIVAARVLQFYQQCLRIPFYPHLHWSLWLFVFFFNDKYYEWSMVEFQCSFDWHFSDV